MEKKDTFADEIDLVELVKTYWSKRRFILKLTLVFLVFGLIVAFTSKVEYKASCKLLPESQDASGLPNLGGLGGLAGLAGVDLDVGASGALTPELYPELVKSVPFQLYLIEKPVLFEKFDSTISSYDYFNHFYEPPLSNILLEYTLGLPGKIKGLFVRESKKVANAQQHLLELSLEDWRLIEKYRKRMSVSVDKKTGVISVSVELPDRKASAQLAQLLVDKLQDDVTKYKIGKVQVNLGFIEERFQEKKKEYEIKQREVALFNDRNINVSSALARTELNRLENELSVAFEVYKGLASQLEQAKIKVKEETPVFTILEPVRVPEEKSKPRRSLIIGLATLSGLIVSSFYLFIQIKFADGKF